MYMMSEVNQREVGLPKINPDFDIICVKHLKKLCLEGQRVHSSYKSLKCLI